MHIAVQARRGFTLVELLVVIAIIGIWLGYCCLQSRRLVKRRDACRAVTT